MVWYSLRLAGTKKKKTAQSKSMSFMYNYMKEKENWKRELRVRKETFKERVSLCHWNPETVIVAGSYSQALIFRCYSGI